MRKILLGLALCIGSPSLAQVTESAVPAAVEATPIPPAPKPLLLRHDTPVELMAPTEVRSDKAPPGTRFKLRVNKPVMADGQIVVPIGTTAWGEVTTATSSSGLGKSGAMEMRLLHIQLGDREIPLDGGDRAKGDGAGSGGLAVLFAGPVGLFHRGNNAKIKAGELVGGYVLRDTLFDPETRQPLPDAPATAAGSN